MGFRIGRIVELACPKSPGNFLNHPFRHVLVILGMTFGNIGTGEDDFRSQSPEVTDFIGTHFIGNDEDQPITFLCCNQGQAEPGVPGSGLDDRSTCIQPSHFFCILDDRESDPVLDRTSGILVFKFDKKPAWSGIHPGDFMHRRVADHLQYRSGIGHGLNLRLVCNVIWKLSKIVTHYQENSDPSVYIRKAITLPGTIGTEDTAITSQGLEDEVAGPAAMKNQSVVLRDVFLRRISTLRTSQFGSCA